MITLCEHESVLELYSLMKNNGREQQAEELASLVAALDSVEAQYSALLPIAQITKARSADPSEQALIQTAMEEVEKILNEFSAAKETVIAWDIATVEQFKQAGVSVLDEPFSDLDVQSLFGSIKEQLQSTKGKLMDAIRQEGGVRAALLSALLTTHFAPPKQDQNASKAWTAATRLGHTAARRHREQEKSSVQQRLEQKKAEVLARPASNTAQNPKGAER